MTLRGAAIGAGLVLLVSQAGHASMTDILIGLDQKVSYAPTGR